MSVSTLNPVGDRMSKNTKCCSNAECVTVRRKCARLVAALEAIEAYAIEALRYEASDVDDPKIAKRVAAYQALRKQHGAGWVPRFFICALLFVGAVTGCSDHAKSVTGPAVDCSVESTRRENPVVCQPPAQPE